MGLLLLRQRHGNLDFFLHFSLSLSFSLTLRLILLRNVPRKKQGGPRKERLIRE